MNDPQEKPLGEQPPQPKANRKDTHLLKIIPIILGITLGNPIGTDIGKAIGETMGWGLITTHGVKYVIIVVASLVIAAITYAVINYFDVDTDKKSS
ncbi:MAG: hypothetical protein ACYC4N_26780 [Pirellulaceae bacterium]